MKRGRLRASKHGCKQWRIWNIHFSKMRMSITEWLSEEAAGLVRPSVGVSPLTVALLRHQGSLLFTPNCFLLRPQCVFAGVSLHWLLLTVNLSHSKGIFCCSPILLKSSEVIDQTSFSIQTDPDHKKGIVCCYWIPSLVFLSKPGKCFMRKEMHWTFLWV